VHFWKNPKKKVKKMLIMDIFNKCESAQEIYGTRVRAFGRQGVWGRLGLILGMKYIRYLGNFHSQVHHLAIGTHGAKE
jgi:hypothetical protein